MKKLKHNIFQKSPSQGFFDIDKLAILCYNCLANAIDRKEKNI